MRQRGLSASDYDRDRAKHFQVNSRQANAKAKAKNSSDDCHVFSLVHPSFSLSLGLIRALHLYCQFIYRLNCSVVE